MVRFKLDEALKNQAKTRYWLAKETGTDFNTINGIVNNKSKAIHLHTIDKICNALQCDIPDILEYIEDN